MKNEELIIPMFKQGIKIMQIAGALNCSEQDINDYLIKYNFNPSEDKYIERDRMICLLKKQGFNIVSISKELNVDRHVIANILKKYNLHDSHKNSYLKIDDPSKQKRNQQIMSLYAEGLSVESVAKRCNVCSRTVINVLTYYNQPIRVQHQIGHSKGTSKNIKHQYNRGYFKNIDTEEKAYWLGFFYADGYVNKSFVMLHISAKDRDHILKFQHSLNAETVPIKMRNEYSSVQFAVCSIEMSKDLTDKGCFQGKSLTLKFPTETQVPSHLISHFMRGYFDGDGCIYVGNKISPSCFSVVGTKLFLDTYERILLRVINRKRRNKRVHQNNWNINTERFCYYGNETLAAIYSFLYKDAVTFLERKKVKFEEAIGRFTETSH